MPDADLPDAPAPQPRDASEVGFAAAREAWAEAARPVLVEAAERYRGLVRLKQLSQAVQESSAVTTTQPYARWIGDVLGRVAADCASRGEPLLSALCVTAQGSVGDTYAESVERARGTRPDDPDGHAAEERLECYRHWHAVGLPRDGGTALRTAHFTPARKAPASKAPAARTPARQAPARKATSATPAAKPRTVSAARKSTEEQVAEPRALRLCPTCFTAVPASGICDYCD